MANKAYLIPAGTPTQELELSSGWNDWPDAAGGSYDLIVGQKASVLPVVVPGLPLSVEPPQIVGLFQEGQTVTGEPGTFSVPIETYEYRWYWQDAPTVPIVGATTDEFELEDGDAGKFLIFEVIATDFYGRESAPVRSPASPEIEEASGTPFAVTSGARTIYLDASATTGTYADGSAWFIRTGRTVTATDLPGANDRHGLVVNPSGDTQGFDIRLCSYGQDPTYEAAKNDDPVKTGEALTLSVDASIVKATSRGELLDGEGEPILLFNRTQSYVERYDVFTAVASSPAAGSFRPGIVASSKTVPANWTVTELTSNMGIFRSVLNLTNATLFPRHTSSARAQRLADLKVLGMVWSTAYSRQGTWHTSRFEGYGRDYCGDHIGPAFADLQSTISSDEKLEIAKALAQIGIDQYEQVKAEGNRWETNGGWMHGRIWPTLLASLLFDDEDMKDLVLGPAAWRPFVEYNQYQFVTDTFKTSSYSLMGSNRWGMWTGSGGAANTREGRPRRHVIAGEYEDIPHWTIGNFTRSADNNTWGMGVNLAYMANNYGSQIMAACALGLLNTSEDLSVFEPFMAFMDRIMRVAQWAHDDLDRAEDTGGGESLTQYIMGAEGARKSEVELYNSLAGIHANWNFDYWTGQPEMCHPPLSIELDGKEVTVTFGTFEMGNGNALTRRDMRYSQDGGSSWTVISDIPLEDPSITFVPPLPETETLVQVRVANSVGNGAWSSNLSRSDPGDTVENSAPRGVFTSALASEYESPYSVVIVHGQSGANYMLDADTQYNQSGRLRPAVSGSLGRYIYATADLPEGLTPGVNLMDVEVTNANFAHGALPGGRSINRGARALMEFMQFIEPTKTPVLIVGAKPGTSMAELMDDSDTDRNWESFNSLVEYARTNYDEPNIIHYWYGSEEPMDSATNYPNKRGLLWMGQTMSGGAHTQGDPNPDNGDARPVDHYMFDVTAEDGDIDRGTYRYNVPKIAFAMHPNPNTGPLYREGVDTVFDDPRLSDMFVGRHFVPGSGHIDGSTDYGQPVMALMVGGPAFLRFVGQDWTPPTITGIEAAPDGTYCDVTVNLPNGGTLTTVRAFYGEEKVPTPVSPEDAFTSIIGFELARPGTLIEDRIQPTRAGAGATSSQITFSIIDSGTGTAPSRTGTVRLTPHASAPFTTGTLLTYRQGGDADYATFDDPQVDLPFFNHLIEHVPSLVQPDTEFVFPGFEVAALDAPFTMAVGALLAPTTALATDGATPTAPDGVAIGDLVLIIGVNNGSTVPTLPSGWTNVTIGGSGAAGSGSQVSFRLCWRVWQSGDTMPTLTNANTTYAFRFDGSFEIGQAASVFGGSSAVLDAPAITPLTGDEARHMVMGAGRSGTNFTAGALSGEDFTRILTHPGTASRAGVYIKPDPVDSIPAVTMPALGGSNGGGVLTIEIVEP